MTANPYAEVAVVPERNMVLDIVSAAGEIWQVRLATHKHAPIVQFWRDGRFIRQVRLSKMSLSAAHESGDWARPSLDETAMSVVTSWLYLMSRRFGL